MVTRTYTILFSTFWLLYILSFIPSGKVESIKQAESIYQYVMIVSVVCGVAFVPIVGKLADNVNPQIMLPTACLVRMSSCVGFYFIDDPTSYFAYFISIMLVLGTLMEGVCNDAVLFRNADREIRGVIFGTSTAFGFTGQFVFSLVGGYLYDEVGPKWPFMLVGACDLTLFVITALLGCFGVI
jgi:MFS family permease